MRLSRPDHATSPTQRLFIMLAAAVAISTPGRALAWDDPAESEVWDSSQQEAIEAHVEQRVFFYTVGLTYTTKNLSLGVAARYLDFLQTTLQSDFVLTSLLTGLALDDLTALRLSSSHAIGARLSPQSPGLAAWHGPKQLPAPWPDVVVGLGGYLVTELDALSQSFRLGDPGFFVGASVGPFVSFVFNSFSVTLVYRPLGKTAYYLDGRWDSTDFQLRNATLDVDFSFTLPW